MEEMYNILATETRRKIVTKVRGFVTADPDPYNDTILFTIEYNGFRFYFTCYDVLAKYVLTGTPSMWMAYDTVKAYQSFVRKKFFKVDSSKQMGV